VTSIAPDVRPAPTVDASADAAPVVAAEKPLRRDAERNRQRILAAAAEMFAARGLDVSLDDIAHHAELGVGTVYRRFPTKQLLVDALFEEHLETLAAVVEEAAAAENPWTGFVDALTEVCRLQASNRGMREVLLSSAYASECAATARDRLTPPIETALRRAQEAGYLRTDVGRIDLIMIEFMIGGVAQYSRHVPDAWRRYLQIVIDGLRARPDQGPLAQPSISEDEMDEAMMAWLPSRRAP
jgi:AcrR family transcriptional regulator